MTADHDNDATQKHAGGRAPRRLSLLTRLLARLGGANPERLAKADSDDVMVAVRTGLALCASCLFIFGGLLCGLVVALHQGQPDLLLLGGAAALIAIIIILIDHAMIQASWMQSGADQLRRIRKAEAASDSMGGSHVALGPAAGETRASRLVKSIALGAFRFVLSLALAFTIATLLELVLFERDITRHVEAGRAQRNAPLVTEIDARLGAQISRLDAQARAAAQALAAAQGEETVQGNLVADMQRQEAAARAIERARLEQMRAEALSEAQTRRTEAIAEREGVRQLPQNSGLAGEGARFRNAQAQAQAHARRAEELLAEIARLDQPSNALTALREQLATARERVKWHAALAEAASAALSSAVAGRTEAVNALVASSQGYVEARDGILLRLDALAALKGQSQALALFALGLKLVLMIAEMGGLASKLLASGPSVYGARTALDAEVGAMTALHEAERTMAVALEGRSALREDFAKLREERARAEADAHARGEARSHFRTLLDEALQDGSARH